MSNENRLKVPVPRRMFLWSLNESSGEIITHIGPTEFTPSANDRVVCDNGRGGFERPPTMEARPFVVARDGEYVVLQNPVRGEVPDDAPNGTYVAGANKEKDLILGSTKVIPGPCGFPLWPGQSAEVRNAHKLGANHYLLVEVVGPIDEKARYARLVIESAGLSSAVIEGEGESPEEGPHALHAEGAHSAGQLLPGQRIVIQGRHTQLFIPPTGIEVVPPLEEMDGSSGLRENEEGGLSSLPPAVKQECAKMLAAVNGGLSAKQFSVMKNELRHRQDLSHAERAIILAALDEAYQEQHNAQSGRGGRRRERGSRSQQPPADPYARRAVVLGPKEFCFLFDADGNARIVRGPARVFPGPYDTFLQRGSRRRSYDAYELAEHQALWLRIISPISREQLAKHLPPNYPLDREHYDAGDELIVRGMPTVFFPFIQAEVLNPTTREPHVGNDHDNVIINAIGIDQKSGIYVRDMRTGIVKMVRGETSYLVDPRYEEHVHRRVPKAKWNLWVAHAEPHKATTEAEVVTPWALSITIPNNEAILITSRHGRRVELGPKVVLLEYEEALTQLRLSKGPSKDGHNVVETCFLRVNGARVADTFDLESSDFVKLRVKLGFAGHFEGETDQERERWFDVEDPVKLLADSVRAKVREAASAESAVNLLKIMPQLVRNALFPGGAPLRFPENGMVIDAVDVLSVSILDSGLAQLFATAQQEAVKLQLQNEQALRRLTAAQQQDEIEAQENAILCEVAKRRANVGLIEAESNHTVELKNIELKMERQAAELAKKQEIERQVHELQLALAKQRADAENQRRLAEAEATARANELLYQGEEKHRAALAAIERDLARGLAEADAVRLAAIQRELVGALQSASDSEVMKAAAQNMNLVSLLGGKSPLELFEQILRGTPLSRTVQDMLERSLPAKSEDSADPKKKGR